MWAPGGILRDRAHCRAFSSVSRWLRLACRSGARNKTRGKQKKTKTKTGARRRKFGVVGRRVNIAREPAAPDRPRRHERETDRSPPGAVLAPGIQAQGTRRIQLPSSRANPFYLYIYTRPLDAVKCESALLTGPALSLTLFK